MIKQKKASASNGTFYDDQRVDVYGLSDAVDDWYS